MIRGLKDLWKSRISWLSRLIRRLLAPTDSQARFREPPDLADPSLYINRELSWLAFNERVLAQARDDAHPLLERVKFLAIAANNLDEFLMVGLASLLRQWRADVDTIRPTASTSTSGWTPCGAPRAKDFATSPSAGTELRPLLAEQHIQFLEQQTTRRRCRTI